MQNHQNAVHLWLEIPFYGTLCRAKCVHSEWQEKKCLEITDSNGNILYHQSISVDQSFHDSL